MVEDMTSPAGRAVAEDMAQDVTAVPPVQAIVRGWTVRDRQYLDPGVYAGLAKLQPLGAEAA